MKTRTIDIIKQKRSVAEGVNESRKQYNNYRKSIKETLGEEPKTIPQIAEQLKMPVSEITYFLMAMQKFGEIEVDSLDDMDEYYFYKLKK